jgi:DNA ligase-1
VQASAGDHDGVRQCRLYSRTGEDISKSFPDLIEAMRFQGSLDGELLVLRERRVQSFNVLQQRLNRKSVTPKLVAEFPIHLRAYDLLVDGSEICASSRLPNAEAAGISSSASTNRIDL